MSRYLWLAALLFVTYLVYMPSLDNAFTNWDDNYYVTENAVVAHPTLQGLAIPLGGNYHPLTMASLAFNYYLSGPRPFSYHWLNLLLHVANTALVFLLVWRLSGRRLWTTVVTALFFGIHPMHVESVAWISERKDVLYALFYLLALLAYLRYLATRRVAWLALTWVVFVLSVASKPAAVVFPLTLLAIDYLKRRSFRGWGVWLEKAPFLVVSATMGALTVMAQRAAGAVAAPQQWTFVQKVLFASYGTVMYVVKLFLPFRLSAIYPYPTAEGAPLGAQYYVAFGVLAVLLPLVVFLFRRNRVVLFGLAFFFINIVLVLQFFSVGQAVMADRYTYLPYIGLFFALAWWLDERPGPRLVGVLVRSVLGVLFVGLAVVSLVQTWRRCEVWQNSGTLWDDAIAKYPGQVVDAYNNRGYYYLAESRYPSALADFNEAIALNPKVARVWVNKGSVFAEQNQNDSAYVCFARAIELKPDYPEALSNRGGIRSRRGDLAGAVEDFSRAIELQPTFRDAYNNRALVYFKMGEYEKAVADRRQVIGLDPKNPMNYVQMGSIALALQQLGRAGDAVAAYGEAIGGAPANDRQRLSGYYMRRSQAWWALHDREHALGDARTAAGLGAAVDSMYLRKLAAP